MNKYPIGFNTKIAEISKTDTSAVQAMPINLARKSVVLVYFPGVDASYSYYNDSFDLKIGDMVYVEGKLSKELGRVVEINYSFKIKLSYYKKVISVVDTNISGEFYFTDRHIVSFDRNAIPYEKAITWLKPPEEDEDVVVGDDFDDSFFLENLSGMKVSQEIAKRGYEYFEGARVSYISLDGTCGRAIVEGREVYEVSFGYYNSEISNIKCTCFCSGVCKHEFAAMLQLQEILEYITENYRSEISGYFAAVSKRLFTNMMICRNNKGKFLLEV